MMRSLMSLSSLVLQLTMMTMPYGLNDMMCPMMDKRADDATDGGGAGDDDDQIMYHMTHMSSIDLEAMDANAV